MRITIVFGVALFLGACQATGGRTADWTVPPGSRLVLNKALTIPAHTGYITLQGGRMVANQAIDSYYPNCDFQLRTKSGKPQTLKPGSFTITRVSMGDNPASGRDIRNYYTEMRLHSEAQPQVYYLKCQQWSNYLESFDYVTVAEIRTALGEYFTLELKP